MSFGKNRSETTQDTRIFDQQSPFLSQLYGAAGNLAGQQQEPVTAAAQQLVQQFLPQLSSVGQQFMDIGSGQTSAQQFMASRLGATNPHLQGVIDSLGENVTRQLGRTLGTDVAGEAAGVRGAFGGSRHGIREGMATEDANRTFAQGAQELLYSDYAAQPAIAESLARTQLGGLQGARAIPGMAYNLGMAQYNAPWMPLQQMAQALGPPVQMRFGAGDESGFSLGI